MLVTSIVCLSLLTVAQAEPSNGETSFPFAMPGLDSTRSAIDVSSLGHPLGPPDRVHIRNGHFVDAESRRVRLLGVNLSFGANFPTHADAEALAAHLAKFGINAVRHHHMDSHDIWKNPPDGTRNLDPEKLERLAYLITQLGKRGVYSDLNIHVSRTFTEAEGFQQADRLCQYNKYTLYFIPRMRELWKQYARDLLTYTNPHTGKRLVDEPSVAMVEITNENDFSRWMLNPLATIPEAYHKPLTERWNLWLKKRYPSTEAMRKAWGEVAEPLGADLADFGDFSRSHAPWHLADHGSTKAVIRPDRSGPKEGQSAIRIGIDRVDGTTWHLELDRGGLSLEKGHVYTLSFWMKAADTREVEVQVARAAPPWNALGYVERITVDKTWRQFVRTFIADETVREQVRFIFKIGQSDATLWLSDPHLRTGGEVRCLPANQRFEDGSLRLPIAQSTKACQQDVRDFLISVEREFFEDTGRFLKQELKVTAPISGTQIDYVDLRSLAVLDYIDAHAYWEHPHWIGKAWTPRGWTIGNTPTVRSRQGGSLTGLAPDRVLGMPYTVSEYNQPAPSDYQVEMAPSFAILSALQDWDGAFIYSFQHGNQAWHGRRIQPFFDINGNPLVMALLPAAAMMYRRGDVSPCNETTAYRLGDRPSAWQAWQHRLGTDLRLGPAQGVGAPAVSAPDLVVSDTGEFTWDRRDPDKARFLLDTPRSKLACGFIALDTVRLGEVTLKTGRIGLGFGAVAVTSMDGAAVNESKRLLITTIAHAQNSGAIWNEKRNSVDDRWGISPPLVEIVPGEVTIRSGATAAFALDAAGARARQVPLVREGPTVRMALDPSHMAVWYELTR